MASSNNLFDLEQIEVYNTNVDAICIFEKIHKEVGEYLIEQIDTNSTDSVFDFLQNLTNRLQEDFDKLIGEDNDKKHFIKVLTPIFVLLLNTKVTRQTK